MIQKRKKYDFFNVNGIFDIDYKDINRLERYISSYGKITPRRKNGLTSKNQRRLSLAIKRARYMALLPYVSR